MMTVGFLFWSVSLVLDEAKSERPKLALSTVIKLIFEDSPRAYLTVIHASGAASD
jgi:hypothetical protein